MSLYIQKHNNKKGTSLSIAEMSVFAMLASLMFLSKLLMEWAPNIHLLGTLTMVYTIAFRKKALIPIYLYVFLNGLYAGFNLWWFPYLYLWTLLWAVTMLLPKRMPLWLKAIVYPLVCSLHGLCYGTLYAPAQALMFGLNFESTIAWIVAGLPWDFIHAAGNLVLGALLILPLSELLTRLSRRIKV